MQRSLRITLAVAVAAGAVMASAGTAFASDLGGHLDKGKGKGHYTDRVTSGHSTARVAGGYTARVAPVRGGH